MNTLFMQKTYTFDEMVSSYLEDIKALRSQVQTPAEETKLQIYYQSANAFKNVAIGDIVQFALSLGRSTSGKSAQMRHAFPNLLGLRVTHPSPIDLAYAQLLLTYTQAFKRYRGNLKNWMLRFVLSSRFSPLHGFLQREIDQVIQHTEQNIRLYRSRF